MSTKIGGPQHTTASEPEWLTDSFSISSTFGLPTWKVANSKSEIDVSFRERGSSVFSLSEGAFSELLRLDGAFSTRLARTFQTRLDGPSKLG